MLSENFHMMPGPRRASPDSENFLQPAKKFDDTFFARGELPVVGIVQ